MISYHFLLPFLLPTFAVGLGILLWERVIAPMRPPREVYHAQWFAMGGVAVLGLIAYSWQLNQFVAGDSYFFLILFGAPFPAFFLLKIGMYLRPTVARQFCPGCGKLVADNCGWKCGYCAHKNYVSFFGKCDECKRPPPDFECYHCGFDVILSEPHDVNHIARRADAPFTPALQIEPSAEKKRKEEQEARRHEIEMTRLNTELAQEEERRKAVAVKEEVKEPSLEDDFERMHTQLVKVHEIAERKIAEAKAKYESNPDLQERAIDAINAWRDKHI